MSIRSVANSSVRTMLALTTRRCVRVSACTPRFFATKLAVQGDLGDDKKKTKKKKKQKKKKKDTEVPVDEVSGSDLKLYNETLKWYDELGPPDDRTPEELKEHEEITKEYSRQEGRIEREHCAFFNNRARVRAAAIEALPTKELREMAKIIDEDDQYPLCIPIPSWTPAIEGYSPFN